MQAAFVYACIRRRKVKPHFKVHNIIESTTCNTLLASVVEKTEDVQRADDLTNINVFMYSTRDCKSNECVELEMQHLPANHGLTYPYVVFCAEEATEAPGGVPDTHDINSFLMSSSAQQTQFPDTVSGEKHLPKCIPVTDNMRADRKVFNMIIGDLRDKKLGVGCLTDVFDLSKFVGALRNALIYVDHHHDYLNLHNCWSGYKNIRVKGKKKYILSVQDTVDKATQLEKSLVPYFFKQHVWATFVDAVNTLIKHLNRFVVYFVCLQLRTLHRFYLFCCSFG